ncbi:MAG: bacteriohopanetetrol glucosamine biosynthesis glycosyltransferase HpnI [Gammaproteobacteria bacterium]
MGITSLSIISWIAVILSFVSCGYVLVAVRCMRRFAQESPGHAVDEEKTPVTLLKPLCGMDPELLENLRSFCLQHYPHYQIIFGVMDREDPAIPVVQQVIKEFPQRDLKLVVDGSLHGSNHKISNLINMYAFARHGLIVISDSDMRVSPDYLNAVTGPFQEEEVGVVTCLYVGKAINGLPSRLGAMFINEWFLPAALVAVRFAGNRYCFGATMVVRPGVLEKIGGLESLADYLADDYMLGRHVIDQGMRVHLAPVVVENVIQEPSLKSLILHELRWARTMRTVQPIGYAFSFLTDALPLSLLAALVIYFSTGSISIGAGLAGFALFTRYLLHSAVNMKFARPQPLWMIPVRDLLTFTIRVVSYMGRVVSWREQKLSVNRAGYI